VKYELQLKNIAEGFRKDVENLSQQKISNCYQCGKCSAGCPVAYAMDYPPSMIMRMVQLGMHDQVMSSNTSWYCVSCETCTTRCPREIDIAKVMDTLKIMAQAGSYKLSENEIPIFDWIFLKSIELTGKIYELGLIGAYNLLSLHPLKDIYPMGLKMIIKGKINFIPHLFYNPSELIKNIRMFKLIRKKDRERIYEKNA